MLRILLAGLLAAPAPARAGEKFIDLLRKGENLAEPREKIEYFSRALKAWLPADGNALLSACHFARGRAYALLDEHPKVVGDMSEALKRDPNSTPAYWERALALLALGRPREALDDLHEFVSRKPEETRGLLQRGEALLRLRRWAEAEKDFLAAAALEPKDAAAPTGIGRAYAGRGHCVAALERYDAAIALAGERHPAAHYHRALCAGRLGRGPESVRDFGAAIAGYGAKLRFLDRAAQTPYRLRIAQEELARAHYGRGLEHRKAGDAALAARDFEEACRMGHEPACRARAAATAAAPKADPAPAAEAPAAPKPAPKRKRGKSWSDGRGERIYAN